MTVSDLAHILAREGVRADAYDLSRNGSGDGYCLRQSPAGWIVFSRERGAEYDARLFAIEDDACRFFLDWISKDPTTKQN